MKKILSSIIVLGTVAAVAVGLSSAFFSDTETSTGNQLEAGKVDLLIDNQSYYNGVFNQDTSWESTNLPGKFFFNFNDLKPGDRGEDTISIKVDDNDAWACMSITKTVDDDNTCTEPEKIDDLAGCDEPDGNVFPNDGELGKNLHFVFWVDDGDNVWETDEPFFKKGQAENIFDGSIWPVADSFTNIWTGVPGQPLTGGQTYYIGKAWCFGDIQPAQLSQDGLGVLSPRTPANSTGGISCDGSGLDNRTQTDIFKADVQFTAEKSRNNPNFVCGPQVSGTPTPTPTPTEPVACPADVMLVLDRSGSINPTELGQLKTAAKQFVDDMGLTPAGIHAGQSSFATTGSLNHILSSNPVTLKAAIDALASGGF